MSLAGSKDFVKRKIWQLINIKSFKLIGNVILAAPGGENAFGQPDLQFPNHPDIIQETTNPTSSRKLDQPMDISPGTEISNSQKPLEDTNVPLSTAFDYFGISRNENAGFTCYISEVVRLFCPRAKFENYFSI